MERAAVIPQCLARAYRFLAEDRAFVAVISQPDRMRILATRARLRDLTRDERERMLHPDDHVRAVQIIACCLEFAD